MNARADSARVRNGGGAERVTEIYFGNLGIQEQVNASRLAIRRGGAVWEFGAPSKRRLAGALRR